MDRKKRRTILIISIFLMLVGFACIVIAASVQGHVDTKLVTAIGFSLFLFWGIGLAVLLKNLSAMMCSALDETAAKMYGEEAFFPRYL